MIRLPLLLAVMVWLIGPAAATARQPSASDWRLEAAGAQDSFGFLRTVGERNLAGDRPVERLMLSPTWPETRYAELWKGQWFDIRRQSLLISCDWLTETGLSRQQAVRLDGRSRGAIREVGGYGPSLIDDTWEPGQRMLGLTCGIGAPPEPRFATTRAAIAFSLSKQPRTAPELSIGGIPPPPAPPDETPPQALWAGSFYRVAEASGGRAMMLDRASLARRGNVVAVQVLTVTGKGPFLNARLNQVEFDCAARTETVTGGRRWGVLTKDIWISAYRFSRPVAGLPATMAALSAACTGSPWFDGQKPVGSNVAEAVAAAR